MIIRGAVIACCVLSNAPALAQAPPPAQKAQDRLARASSLPTTQPGIRTAVVDATGKIIPIAPSTTDIEIMGAGGSGDDPCPGADALPVKAAKSLVLRIAAEEKFYPEFVLAVAKIESRYVSTAVSKRGGYGLMQLSMDAAKRFKVDRCDPAENVRGGVRRLRALHARYRNPFFILAAWNAGEQALADHQGIPPFPDTARFIADVMNEFYDWPALSGSAAAEQGAGAGANRSGAPRPSASAIHARTPASPSAGAPFTAGFVMHVE